MAHIKDVKIGNNTYLVEPVVYAATAGTSSAITAAVSNFALDTGVIVTLKITTTNAADATLNVNSTGAKTLKYNNANLVASVLKVNRFYSFVYDGTYWQLIGELDTNTLVKQTSKSDNVNYKILTTTSASPTSGSAAEAAYSANIYANPSTGTLNAVRHSFNVSGTEKAYLNFNSADSSLDLIFI